MTDEPRPPREERKFSFSQWWKGVTGWLRNKDGKVSRIAVLAYIMLAAFLSLRFTWDKWSFLAFVAPGALLVANAVAEKIPLSDMLDAWRAGSTAKIVERLGGMVAGAVAPPAPGTVVTETTDSSSATKVTTVQAGEVGTVTAANDGALG